jgi:hypothetical protein
MGWHSAFFPRLQPAQSDFVHRIYSGSPTGADFTPAQLKPEVRSEKHVLCGSGARGPHSFFKKVMIVNWSVNSDMPSGASNQL